MDARIFNKIIPKIGRRDEENLYRSNTEPFPYQLIPTLSFLRLQSAFSIPTLHLIRNELPDT